MAKDTSEIFEDFLEFRGDDRPGRAQPEDVTREQTIENGGQWRKILPLSAVKGDVDPFLNDIRSSPFVLFFENGRDNAFDDGIEMFNRVIHRG